jgi:NADH-quinone oxidoreductase subunit L
MKVAMGLLAVLALVAGVLQIPKVTHVLHDFLEPAFHDSRFYEELEPTTSAIWIGLVIGGALSLLGIFIASRLFLGDAGRRTRIRERASALHGFFFNKWYFDELIDVLVVRPFSWFGRFARNTFERLVITGLFVGGTTGAVRAGSAAVRALQSGYLRYYAALLALGVACLALYFLIAG